MSARFVVMGVAGCGKSTVAAALALRLGLAFVDGDALHPSANIEKMSRGVPLCDDDRWPWLARVGETLRGGRTVVACSALKRSYRSAIAAQAGAPVTFLFLQGDREVLQARMSARPGHFMPASLLDSQLATLEVPDESERCVRADIRRPVDDLVAGLVKELEERRWIGS